MLRNLRSFEFCNLSSDLTCSSKIINFMYEFYNMFFCSLARFISLICQKPDIYSTVPSCILIYRESIIKSPEFIYSQEVRNRDMA
jgi:hypothetical protein